MIKEIRFLIAAAELARGHARPGYERELAKHVSKGRVETLTELSEAEQQKLLNGLRKKLTNLQQEQERV
jgi:hypothetical protein